MNSISLDAVAALTGIGRSTLWRRVADGVLAKGEKDARGRATLALADALGLVREGAGISLGGDDVAVLLQADAGDAQAQADIGVLLYLRGGGRAREAALYWLHAAAEQGSAEAMQWLGIVHAAGGGEPGQHHLAVMWVAKAASLGHLIARRQLDGLLGAVAVDAGGRRVM